MRDFIESINDALAQLRDVFDALDEIAPIAKSVAAVREMTAGWPMTVSKDDGGTMASGDLASGGKVAPAQGVVPKDRRTYRGLEVVVDRPVGFVQQGTAADGKTWERTYKNDYGFIPHTQGGDGDELDVFLGPDDSDETVHWVVQSKDGPDGSKVFDEFKAFLGFGSKEAARACYDDHIPPRHRHSMTSTSLGMVKALVGVAPTEVMKALAREAIGAALFASSMGARFTETFIGTEPPAGAWLRVGKAVAATEIAPVEDRFVLGPVLIPDTVDGQNDTVSAAVIEKAAWQWFADFQNMGLQHKMLAGRSMIQPTESYIVRADTTINGRMVKAGTWVLGAIIKDDALWQGVKDGTWTGWSIGGHAKKARPGTPGGGPTP